MADEQEYVAHNVSNKDLEKALQEVLDNGAKPGQIIGFCYVPASEEDKDKKGKFHVGWYTFA